MEYWWWCASATWCVVDIAATGCFAVLALILMRAVFDSLSYKLKEDTHVSTRPLRFKTINAFGPHNLDSCVVQRTLLRRTYNGYGLRLDPFHEVSRRGG